MGKLEGDARRRRRLGHVQQAALVAIALPGILAVSVVAGSIMDVIKSASGNRRRFQYYSDNVLTKLAAEGYIRFEERRGKRYARITPEGLRYLALRGHTLAQQVRTKKRWDRRWRVIIFDIPEKRKTTRDALRSMMRGFQFYLLQGSVWVYPYDCEDEIALAKAELKLGANVIYMIVEKMEQDQHLKEHFGLR